jgi:hypothetical protein
VLLLLLLRQCRHLRRQCKHHWSLWRALPRQHPQLLLRLSLVVTLAALQHRTLVA